MDTQFKFYLTMVILLASLAIALYPTIKDNLSRRK